MGSALVGVLGVSTPFVVGLPTFVFVLSTESLAISFVSATLLLVKGVEFWVSLELDLASLDMLEFVLLVLSVDKLFVETEFEEFELGELLVGNFACSNKV